MRWWGWGVDADAIELPDAAEAMLREELDLDGSVTPHVPLEEVRLPGAALPEAAREKLAGIVGAENVRDDREARVSHAGGKSYPDLFRIRSGDGSSAPDAVVLPASRDQLAPLLQACAGARVAVVPFGGGSSVVGGVEPLRDGFLGAISLDLSLLADVIDLDPKSLTATLEPGIFGPDLEQKLARAGLTLGHFPQSFEYSTVGGWVATRSAGQASTGYGRIDELVEALSCSTPAGEIETRLVPASAAGPSLRDVIVGSEGTLGVISQATLRVRPLPASHRYEAWSFRSFAEGTEALRVMEQAEASPDVARISDESETRLSLALASTGSTKEQLGRRYLRLRGHEGGCVTIVGFEGDADDVERQRLRTAAMLRGGGGLYLGQGPGRAWLRGRYAAPYLRDALLDRGVFIDTLETATTWSNLDNVYARVGDALRSSLSNRGTPPLVMCHVSHLYGSGASLYFTFLARQEQGAELDQWRAAKTAASDAIVAAGGTITHHHAIGKDHAPWLKAEVGELGVEVLRTVKEELDPAGIMNPGKLLPAP